MLPSSSNEVTFAGRILSTIGVTWPFGSGMHAFDIGLARNTRAQIAQYLADDVQIMYKSHAHVTRCIRAHTG